MGFSGKNTEVSCRGLLQGIFPTQGFEPVSLIVSRYYMHWQLNSLPLVTPGKPLNDVSRPDKSVLFMKGYCRGQCSVFYDIL